MNEEKVIVTLSTTETVNVTQENIDDIMVCALEGGINHWCYKAKVVGGYLGEYASEQISRGGSLLLYLIEPFDDEETEVYELTKEKFLHGLDKWMNETSSLNNYIYEGNLDCGNIDAIAADLIIQYALFDEIIYA